MHLTRKTEATKPAAANVLQQPARFDTFLERYNHGRPHQAFGMKVPADLYARSPRVDRGLAELTYPFHDHTITDQGQTVAETARWAEASPLRRSGSCATCNWIQYPPPRCVPETAMGNGG
jgi:hypothetical protein